MSTHLAVSLPPFLHEQDGEIRLTGHRISLVDILVLYRDGFSPEMLAARYASIDLSQIHYVIGFYLENQAAVDAYLEAYLADCQRLRNQATPSPQQQRLRQRLLTLRHAQRKAQHVG